MLLHDTESYEDSLDEFNNVLEIDENRVGTYRYLGFCYKALEKPELAISSFNAAVDENPLDGEVFTELAEIHVDKEQFEKASTAIEKALKIKGDDVKAIFLKGIIAAKKGNIQEAIRRWEEVVSINGEHVLAEEARKSIGVAQNWVKILGQGAGKEE
jgi:tetratricopeptide (TPR) repeat protein